MRAGDVGNGAAATDQHTYFKSPLWWAGMTLSKPVPKRWHLGVCINKRMRLLSSGPRRECVSKCIIFRPPLMEIMSVLNFVAYTFAPPILVTPLGALSVIIG